MTTTHNEKTITEELRAFEEAIGEFVGFEIHGDRIIVAMRNISSFSILLPRSTSRAFQDVKSGNRIGILCTDDQKAPIRVRRI